MKKKTHEIMLNIIKHDFMFFFNLVKFCKKPSTYCEFMIVKCELSMTYKLRDYCSEGC